MNQTPPESQSYRSYACPRCGAVYGSERALASHVSSHVTGAPTDPYVCLDCGESFDSRRELEEHWRVHGESNAEEAGRPEAA
jgi:DNA-directed RNA polymerase subunit RPC12/RpoP